VIPNRTRIDHGASGRGFRGVGAQSIQRNLRGRASAVARRWFTVAGASSASVNAAGAFRTELDERSVGEHRCCPRRCRLNDERRH
jgi:hypothetical protein